MNPTEQTLSPLQIALEIRKGLFRLQDVPPEMRPLVAGILQHMTDAQAGQLAAKSETRHGTLGRTHTQFRNALS